MIFHSLRAASPHLIFGSRLAHCQINRRDLPSLWWRTTRAASWVITDSPLPLLRPRAGRALSAQANRQTRSRVFYLANWRRIENGLAGVSVRGCCVTHLRVRWRERTSLAARLCLSARWTKKPPCSGGTMGSFLHRTILLSYFAPSRTLPHP